MTLLELADRCEAASGPDRELDAAIVPLQGLTVVDEGYPIGRMCYDDTGCAQLMPRYTASIDAAMTLVPEGHEVVIGNDQAFCYAAVAPKGTPDSPAYTGSTMAIALCAAALRARAAQSEIDHG